MTPEKSRMTDFIADFLKKSGQSDDRNAQGVSTPQAASEADTITNIDPDSFTHLIAMPVDKCHELMLGEFLFLFLDTNNLFGPVHVQPLLTHHSFYHTIPSLNPRTELESVQRAILYHCPVLVHACLQQAMARLPLLYVKATGPSSTQKLFRIVEDVMEDHLLQPVEDDNDADDKDLNEFGTKPFTLQFNSLDIDGPRNEVLHAVATTADSQKLQVIVQDLQQRIERETNWSTLLPPDDHAETTPFRARIPFMRLPDNWEDLLEPPDESMADDGFVFRPSEEGGNGISPIFWGKWADDDFGTARMREVAVYKRYRDVKGLDEKAFYLPEKFLPLPEGTQAMIQQETRFKDYDEKRILEAEGIQAELAAGEEPVDVEVPEDDTMLQMTKKRLEALYAQDAKMLSSMPLSSDQQKDDNTKEDEKDIITEGLVDETVDPLTLDDWTRDRIQNIIASRAKVQSEQELAKPKNKPPIAENKIFQKYKDGTLAPQQPEETKPAPKLPPFPSRQHCVGFWKVLQSPTGFDVEETDNQRSDNFLLRVDGTIAGGPILDQATRQKASGGTWRLEEDDCRLRIRLVIPPGKEHILVMQGQMELIAGKPNIALASSTFGIPQLEARKARAAETEPPLEDILYCKGEVWVEDAVTKKNRCDVGTFSLMKLNTSADPKDFTITIPQPIRNQD